MTILIGSLSPTIALCLIWRPMKVEIHLSTVSTGGFHTKSIIEQPSNLPTILFVQSPITTAMQYDILIFLWSNETFTLCPLHVFAVCLCVDWYISVDVFWSLLSSLRASAVAFILVYWSTQAVIGEDLGKTNKILILSWEMNTYGKNNDGIKQNNCQDDL